MVLTRISNKPECLETLVSEFGFSFRFLPLIATRPIQLRAEDIALLTNLSNSQHRAVVFTSSEAIKSLKEFGVKLSDDLQYFCQGRSTANCLRELYSLNAWFPLEPILSEGLAEVVAAQMDPGACIFFPSALETSGGFLARSKELGLEITNIPIYETRPANVDQGLFADLFKNYKEVIFLIFSPSVVESLASNIKKIGINRDQVKCIGVGSKTSKKIIEKKFNLIVEYPHFDLDLFRQDLQAFS